MTPQEYSELNAWIATNIFDYWQADDGSWFDKNEKRISYQEKPPDMIMHYQRMLSVIQYVKKGPEVSFIFNERQKTWEASFDRRQTSGVDKNQAVAIALAWKAFVERKNSSHQPKGNNTQAGTP